ncbi:MAG: hypothetical protein COZ74_13765 [Flavobacteriaceae bacterium CG_4_8_14_3_um_filter_31_8]|nr:MAG: hypothetical protein COZ74_13765 [Flavobacteriaceae bacterium CG_4_8_14_3_um_filter_31_8]
MEEIISCESHWEYSIQSRHFYNKKNVPIGYTVGMREESWGLVQIHLPAHPKISKEQAIDPDFAIDFLAKNLSRGKAKMWSCYKLLAQK